MSTPTTRAPGSAKARDLRLLLDGLAAEVPGIRSVAVVSSDGLLLLASDPALGAEHGQLGRRDQGQGEHGGQREPEEGPAGTAERSVPGGPASPGEARVPPMRRRRGEAGRQRGRRGSSGDLATIVSGVASLTTAAARLTDAGAVKQTMVAMDEGALLVMTIGDGSLLGVHAEADADLGAVGYRMGLFVGRAGHLLTPELRSELHDGLARPGGTVSG